MRRIKNQLVIAGILFFGISTNAQDRLMTLGYVSANIELAENFKEYEEVPLISNETFTYKYKGEEVIVNFNEDEHIEYYNNGEHYIKSNLTWVSKDECIITLDEITLPDLPFKPGNSLRMKITSVRGKYVYYESTLAGRTWKGKMKRVKQSPKEYVASK